MHWGEENTHELSSEQREYAQFLADLGVDLTIGSHAHVIQPVEYIERSASSSDKDEDDDASASQDDDAQTMRDDMLCVYGLGDFVSGYTLPKTILSGMFTCDFVRDEVGKVTVQNPVWHGVVEHCEGDSDAVYLLSDYDDDLAQRNTLLARVGENDEYTTSDPLEWAQQTTLDVVGDVIPVEV
jgi:poly-gamma-glutamate synthesis protein (capsule biosynthesis protein)